jgi:hypothetical protein
MTSSLCRALFEGLSDHLPPATLAALQCTSAELNATIRDCELWRKLIVRRSTCAELYRLGCHFIDSKGVQQVNEAGASFYPLLPADASPIKRSPRDRLGVCGRR